MHQVVGDETGRREYDESHAPMIWTERLRTMAGVPFASGHWMFERMYTFEAPVAFSCNAALSSSKRALYSGITEVASFTIARASSNFRRCISWRPRSNSGASSLTPALVAWSTTRSAPSSARAVAFPHGGGNHLTHRLGARAHPLGARSLGPPVLL